MSIIKVQCVDQSLKVIDAPLISSGGIDTDIVKFEFCPLWDGYTKRTAIFYRDENNVYSSQILDPSNEAVIPKEVLQNEGFFNFGVYAILNGTDDEGNVTILKTLTSQVVSYRVVKGALTEANGMYVPTENELNQLLEAISESNLLFYYADENDIEAILNSSSGVGDKEVLNVTLLNQYHQGLNNIVDEKIDSEINAHLVYTDEEYEYGGN